MDTGRADRRRREDRSIDRGVGILSLARSYDNTRVDAACRRGILIKARSVASIRSILKSGLDRAFLDETSDHQPLRHGNIRGQGYFH
jgi:transposase